MRGTKPRRPLPIAKAEGPIGALYEIWDRRKRRWLERVFGHKQPMSLEEVAAYVRGGTMGRYGPNIVRDWELREVIPAVRPLRHTGEDLLALGELLDLSGDPVVLDEALAAWARAHAPVAPKR